MTEFDISTLKNGLKGQGLHYVKNVSKRGLTAFHFLITKILGHLLIQNSTSILCEL